MAMNFLYNFYISDSYLSGSKCLLRTYVLFSASLQCYVEKMQHSFVADMDLKRHWMHQ